MNLELLTVISAMCQTQNSTTIYPGSMVIDSGPPCVTKMVRCYNRVRAKEQKARMGKVSYPATDLKGNFFFPDEVQDADVLAGCFK